MKKRSLFLSIVMFSVCIVPVTSLASSWSNWAKYIQMPAISSISNFVDSETAKKLSPFLILASLVAYYYWTNKKSNNISREVFDIASGLKPGEGSIVKSEDSASDTRKLFSIPNQYPVVHQDEDHGGAASCGYHTVLNALELVKSKIADENDATLVKTLMSDEEINDYFGEDGTWRKFIIHNRKRVEVKRLLEDGLKKCFDGKNMQKILVSYLSDDAFKQSLDTFFSDYLWSEHKTKYSLRGSSFDTDVGKYNYIESLPAATWSEKNREYIKFMVFKASSLYESMLVSFASFMTNTLWEPDKDSASYNFTNTQIKEILRYELDKMSSDPTAGFIQVLKQDRLLSNVIDFNLMRRKLFLDSGIETMAGIVDKILEFSDRKDDFNGEWLDGQEVAKLWEYAMENPKFLSVKDVKHCFRAIPSFDLLGQNDTVVPDCKENMKNAFDEGVRCFNIIAMGTMRQLSDTQVVPGHWYPLVMDQSKDGSKQWYVMDSLGSDRVSDPNVLKIIELIEQ